MQFHLFSTTGHSIALAFFFLFERREERGRIRESVKISESACFLFIWSDGSVKRGTRILGSGCIWNGWLGVGDYGKGKA